MKWVDKKIFNLSFLESERCFSRSVRIGEKHAEGMRKTRKKGQESGEISIFFFDGTRASPENSWNFRETSVSSDSRVFSDSLVPSLFFEMGGNEGIGKNTRIGGNNGSLRAPIEDLSISNRPPRESIHEWIRGGVLSGKKKHPRGALLCLGRLCEIGENGQKLHAGLRVFFRCFLPFQRNRREPGVCRRKSQASFDGRRAFPPILSKWEGSLVSSDSHGRKNRRSLSFCSLGGPDLRSGPPKEQKESDHGSP